MEFFTSAERPVLKFFLTHVRTPVFMDLNTVKMSVIGASQMVHGFSELVALPEDFVSVLRTHKVIHHCL